MHQDPCINVLKLNAAHMQGILVAGALVIQNAAKEQRSTVSSHLVSMAMTADPPSLALSAAPATMSLAPLASVSDQLGALKQ